MIKVGNKVKIISAGETYTGYSMMAKLMKAVNWKRNCDAKRGDEGIVKAIRNHEDRSDRLALVDIDSEEFIIGIDGLQKISGRIGRPPKPKFHKFVAFYEETNKDSYKLFYTKKELKELLEEAKDDEKIDFDSIKAYPLGEPFEISLNIKLK